MVKMFVVSTSYLPLDTQKKDLGFKKLYFLCRGLRWSECSLLSQRFKVFY